MQKLFAQFSLSKVVLLLGLAASSYALANSHHNDEADYEPAILEILKTIKSGDLDSALQLADAHVAEFPKSRVGHLLRADILQAMVYNPIALTRDDSEVGEEAPETTSGIRHQLKNRWLHYQRDQETAHQKVPASLVDMGRHKHVMVSDMQSGRLYLYRNVEGQPKLVRDYYLSVGSAGFGKEYEGDNKTPVGVYSIYQHIAGSELPDLYGKGAYPVDYPNVYDRALKRTGYGIWLHGTPSNTYARAPWASEGCFVLSNADLLDIEQYIDVEERTPVVLADSINWISQQQLAARRTQLSRAIQDWKHDWENLDTDAYLAHYSEQEFNFGTTNFAAWADRKRAVNKGKTFVQVDMSIDSLFLYPGEEDMFVVSYTQNYLSNNYAGKTKKQQFWRKDDNGRWKIIYES